MKLEYRYELRFNKAELSQLYTLVKDRLYFLRNFLADWNPLDEFRKVLHEDYLNEYKILLSLKRDIYQELHST